MLLSFTVGCATEKPYQVAESEPYEFSDDGLTLRLERLQLPVGDPGYVEFALELEGDQCRQERKLMVYPEGSSFAGDGVFSVGDQVNTSGSIVCDCCLFLGQRPPHTVIAEHYGARIEVQFEEIDWPEGRWRLVDRDSEPRVRTLD